MFFFFLAQALMVGRKYKKKDENKDKHEVTVQFKALCWTWRDIQFDLQNGRHRRFRHITFYPQYVYLNCPM